MGLLAWVLALGLLVYLRRHSPRFDRGGGRRFWIAGLAGVAATLAGWWLARNGTLGPAPGRPVMIAWLQAMSAVALCLGIAVRLRRLPDLV
jgi:hypothetical protein